MKRLLFILILSFYFLRLPAQDYTEKYNKLRERYEYFDSSGNIMGYKKWNSLRKQWETTDLRNGQGSKEGNYIQPYDTDMLYEIAKAKQAEHNRRVYADELKRLESERAKKNSAIDMMNDVIDVYNSAESYPNTIKDGWHTAYAMNKSSFCQERKVYVKDNKITKYVVDNIVFREIVSSLPIQKGKGSIKIKGSENDLVSLYFIDYIYNPNSIIPSLSSGKISFWTNKDTNGRKLNIWLEGIYIGALNSYFKKDTPNCEQSGTCTVEIKVGTYNYTANDSYTQWGGTVTITSNGCQIYGLSKK